MKKMLKLLSIVLFLSFILIPFKANAQSTIWSQAIDLTDSVSSSIVKVEDGVIVMQYEGAASSNNLLIKYDFDGNKIWEINNNYGYNIESVSDGFIVWNQSTITKFDKDKNIKWSVNHPESGVNNYKMSLLEVSDGYILCKTEWSGSLHKLDKNGNLVLSKNLMDEINMDTGYSCGRKYCNARNYASTITSDGKNIAILSTGTIGSDYNKYQTIISIIDSNLKLVDSKYFLAGASKEFYSVFGNADEGNMISKMVATDDGYVIAGTNLLKLNNNGKMEKIISKRVLDIVKIGEYIYAYELQDDSAGENEYYYQTAVVKYDKDLNKKNTTKLGLSLYSTSINPEDGITGIAHIKNRAVYYEYDSKVDSIVLNTPISAYAMEEDSSDNRYIVNKHILGNSFSMTNNLLYGIARYRVSETEKKDGATEGVSGVINNIVKNPETNSIIIIAVFIILILIISIISYTIYKNKVTNTKEKKQNK